MARIYVNYIYNKAKDEYKVLDSEYVYENQKVAVMETEDVIEVPLVVPINHKMTVVDRARFEAINKKFYLASDENGKVYEDTNGVELWLPKDTDVSRLRFINGQLLMVEDEEEVKNEDSPENIEESDKGD